MTDDSDTATEDDTGADVGHDPAADRTTAPMSDFSAGEALTGALVALVGIAIAFGIPLLTVGV
ncbi:hypothetical protein NP511_02375 [Natrinema thermotolerans]|uniref:Uncharacterized protein n=1 Tax=Natrinema thermotolerans TaxID=121872 RepID=A0AAF0PB33_9EURY|nr:hypothetical protein [Natrinema thermotolerans]ELZ15650.1 hypothetical protein C478_05374 [Natrinema thermotolerans DSM 11552]QCC60804.1 hypothetical protein DVR14_20055 [Natrinema thermotolerans]QCC61683.1 hypothetical protein DVR14_24195 [Natrinema thermotolerans]WMT07855.1 hypothetical protein NP511_21090 [Natrinema thermotolerans]WMT08487.1 hypothetical protein NP511_02375 [Natrinema thermotolerans]